MVRTTLPVLVGLQIFLSYIQPCLAQKATFQWKFSGDMFSTTLTACQPYPVLVQSRNGTNGTAPYYMMAYEPNGVTTSQFIGTDPTNLTWTVDHAPGASVMLTVADSLQNAGGVAPSLYSVQAGTSTSCIPPRPTTNVTIVANVTGNLQSCQPFGLRVYGGQMPYNISIAALNSPVVTNVTLPISDDVFTWINRADPNGQLLVAVSDANGTWGTSTPIANTFGSTNVDCVGLVSRAGNSSTVDQHPKPPAKSHTTAIVAGVVVSIIVVLILGGIGFFIWRRRQEQKNLEPEPAWIPEAWSVNPSDNPNASTTRLSSKQAMAMTMTSHGNASMSQLLPGPSSSSGASGSSPSGPSFGQGSYYSPLPSPSGGSRPSKMQREQLAASGSSSRLPPGLPSNWQVEPDIIIQHRDGGAVQEIPPPYGDRVAGAEQEQQTQHS